ncbi:MAG: alcohol dehydrogenase catalytic domain-containing protein [Deltaproteobacteria bacterium]|nr:alcohol dehydrogenase catalytic domain-containing protein [Deltaproteobacteria bacterium]
MRVILFEQGKIREAEVPMPVPGRGEALLAVRLAGICNTDLELLSGYYGFSGIAGHECVADVAGCESRPDLVGKRVVVAINNGCDDPACEACAGGDARHCPSRTVLGIQRWDGAFAEFITAPVKNLVPVPESVDDRTAVFAEPLAAALRILDQVEVSGKKAAVLGDGKLGVLCALALSPYAKSLVLVGKHPHRVTLARSLGFSARQGDSPGQGGRYDVVVEATGSPEGLDAALSLVWPRGVVVLKTTCRDKTTADLSRLVVDEVTLVGSRCGDMGKAMRFLAEKGLDAEALIEATYPFTRHREAFGKAMAPGAGKVLMEMRKGR